MDKDKFIRTIEGKLGKKLPESSIELFANSFRIHLYFIVVLDSSIHDKSTYSLDKAVFVGDLNTISIPHFYEFSSNSSLGEIDYMLEHIDEVVCSLTNKFPNSEVSAYFLS
tara:strand:+ start:17005 stop:17337 length:333 start_codon:yes stop_codon:yes gene_type:complete